MPNDYLKKVSDQRNMKIAAVEKVWERAKTLAKERFSPDDEQYYAYTTGIFKRMLSLARNDTAPVVLSACPSVLDQQGFDDVIRKLNIS